MIDAKQVPRWTGERAFPLLLLLLAVGCGSPGSASSNAEADSALSDTREEDSAEAIDSELLEDAIEDSSDEPDSGNGSGDTAADGSAADTEDTDLEDANLDSTTDSEMDSATEDSSVSDGSAEDTTDTTVEDVVDTTPPPFPACPLFAAGVSAGFVSNLAIREASGIAASRRYGNVLWTHNDSGDSNRVFAIATNGSSFATYVLSGADANDWEDIAVGPGPDPSLSYVYVGDIGDNGGNRNSIEVYRFAEPEVVSSLFNITLTNVDRLEFRYPDNRGENAETMMVDPRNGDIYVVSKSGTGEARVYRASPPFVPLDRVTMTLVAQLQFGTAPLIGDPSTTAGDFSPSGDLIAIRTYDTAYAWRRPADTTVDEALATAPCPLPIRSEGQGEAFGFNRDGTGYFTMGEGSLVQLSSYTRR